MTHINTARSALLSDLHLFSAVTHGLRTSRPWVANWHHDEICTALERVASGEITRLIINVPPGYSKTQIAMVNFVAQSFCRNPKCKFIIASYSQSLAHESSRNIRSTLQLEVIKDLFPLKFRDDKNAVGAWQTVDGGSVLAASSGGQITGFHAGVLGMDQFSGALIIDDPIKPDDVSSAVRRATVYDRFGSTFRSRIIETRTPIILIMQRLHADDLSGFLLKGGSPADVWDHLILQAHNDGPIDYPSEYTHGRQMESAYRPLGPLWPAKQGRDELAILRDTSPWWSSQYQQIPKAHGGVLFRPEWWSFYESYEPQHNRVWVGLDVAKRSVHLKRKIIYADTAQKTGQQHDYSVFQCWALGDDGNIYLLDQMRGKWDAPDLRANFTRFCDRHEFRPGENLMGVYARRVEDKSSGTGLIQEINAAKARGYVTGIPRDKDKVSRAHGVTLPLSQHRVFLPRNATWIDAYLNEFADFAPDMSHKHDDQVDCTMDAITEFLMSHKVDYARMVGTRQGAQHG